MSSLSTKYIDTYYPDLLQVSNTGSGVDSTLRDVESGSGTATKLQLSTTGVKFTGTVAYGSYSVAFGGNFSVGGAFTTSAYDLTLTTTASTNVTLPTTGTLATRAGSETLTNKTLTAPVIATISNTGTLTLPTSTDTLVGRATTDTLTNKTLTNPIVTTGSFTSPTLITPVLGTPSSGTLTSCTGLPLDTGVTGTLPVAHGGTGVTSSNPVIQRVSTYISPTSHATTIPYDDTIPQNTEGFEAGTLSITPTNSANILVIDVQLLMSNDAATPMQMIAALFQDTNANAINAAIIQNSTQLGGATLRFRHIMSAGTTSATTFKVRFGASAGGNTTTISGSNSTTLFGGIAGKLSSIMITEYAA